MSLREEPIVRPARLPGGQTIQIRISVPDDPYIPRSELDTVVVELVAGDEVLGLVTTPLSASDAYLASRLADRLRAALETGTVAPTAESIEQLATSI